MINRSNQSRRRYARVSMTKTSITIFLPSFFLSSRFDFFSSFFFFFFSFSTLFQLFPWHPFFGSLVFSLKHHQHFFKCPSLIPDCWRKFHGRMVVRRTSPSVNVGSFVPSLFPPPLYSFFFFFAAAEEKIRWINIQMKGLI